jgi:putative membrane protein
MVLAFPFILLTFGIFTLFINALMFYLTGLLVRGFHVESFGSAFLASIIVSVASMVLGPRRGRGRVLHARFRIDL